MKHQLIFKKINNAMLDMQASTSQTFESHFLTFARHVADPSLAAINQKITFGLDVEDFLSASVGVRTGMAGSARLMWPADDDKVLGLKWLLVQKLARKPNTILSFSHVYYNTSRDNSSQLHSLVRQLLIPFWRDYKDFVMMQEGGSDQDMIGASDGVEPSKAVGNVIYNMIGINARVNHNSTDNSVNTTTISADVINKTQLLRNEIQNSPLTDVEKAEAIEVVDALDEQFEGGKPKKSIVKALIASLPAIESVTTIGNAIVEMAQAYVNA